MKRRTSACQLRGLTDCLPGKGTYLIAFACFVIGGCAESIEPEVKSSPPVVHIIAPTNNATVFDTVLIQVDATDDRGIAKVEIYINDSTDSSKTLSSRPYTYLWRTPQVEDSSRHTLFAKAYDEDGNVTSTEVRTINVLKFQPASLLRVTHFSDDLIKLRWKDNSVAETGFDIEMSLGPSNFNLVTTLPPNSDSAEIAGSFIIDSTYYFRVSVKQDHRVLLSQQVACTIFFPPPVITNVQVLADTAATINWADNSSFESSFEIELSDNGSSYSLIASPGANATAVTVPGIYLATKTYSFRARAKTTNNVTSYSPVVSRTIALVPPQLTNVQFLVDTAVRIDWVDNSSFESGFEIEQSDDGVTYSVIDSASANSTTMTTQGVYLTTKTYSFRARAKSRHNSSSYSAVISRELVFPPPGDLHMTCLSPTSIRLGWTDSASFEEGYRLLQSVNNQPFAELMRLSRNTTSYMLANLNEGNTYRFRIDAYTRYNYSMYSSLSISCVTSPQQLLYSCQIRRTSQPVYSIAFSPNGEVLACGGEHYVDLFRVGDGKSLAQLPHVNNYPVWSVRYSPDGTLLATGHSDATYLWNTTTNAQIARLYLYPTSQVYSVDFSPGGDSVAAADNRGNIQLWSVSSRTLLTSYYAFNWNNQTIDISPDGQFVATGDSLMILRLSNGSLVRAFPSSKFLRSVAYHPGGGFVASVGANDYRLELWDVSDGSLTRAFQESHYARDIAFDASGHRIATAGREDAVVNIWDTQTGSLVVSLDNSTPSHSVAFSPLNNIIATGDRSGTVRVWGFAGTWRTDF